MTKHDPLGLDPLVKQEEQRRKLLAEVEKNAYALDSSKDDAKKAAMSVEEQKRAQDEARKREIMDVEPDVSKDILRVARTIDQIVNNEVFTTEVWLDCRERVTFEDKDYSGSDYKAQVTVRDGSLEVSIKHTKREGAGRWYESEYNEEATISINTKKDKIEMYYTVRKREDRKNDGIYRLSRFFRKAPKAFRFLAEDFIEKSKPFYINDFISMYKAIPEILAEAIAKMKQEQEAKKRQLEREQARLRREANCLAEREGPAEEEPERSTFAKEPEYTATIIERFGKKTYKFKKEIEEIPGIYTSRRRKR